MNKKYIWNLTLKDLILISFFAALMVIGAFIKIQIPPVPITFQPFFCALSGIFLGSKKALLSQLLYIFIGLVGLPVFAYGGGLGYIAHPTFGFIIGFAIAAFLIGLIIEKSEKITISRNFIALITGLVSIYIVGLLYFSMIQNIYLNAQGINGLAIGFYLFFIKDLFLFIIIGVLANIIVPRVRRAINFL